MTDTIDLEKVTPIEVSQLLPPIQTAAILIIGDEILNGKIKDTNSSFFAKYCFDLGIDLKKIEVVGDNEEDISTSIKALYKKYDFIFTSGGIGSTHDDITYPVIAKALNLDLKKDEYVVSRMKYLNGRKRQERGFPPRLLDEYQQAAELRMATLPTGDNATNYFVSPELWVPLVAIGHKVFILPGIPELFVALANGLKPYILGRIANLGDTYLRFYVTTTMSESEMAPFLSQLQEAQNKILGKGVIKIGSYPHMKQGINTVSIIGREKQKEALRAIVNAVVEKFHGKEISEEKENSFALL